ncbi:MAG: VPDSG-CTERM sorting domain-containing protein [Verrucomicrobiales bacterium]|nr:VPDSG-CTERM sorting domain-containing protein [Verrucomicrobiales bacterium]
MKSTFKNSGGLMACVAVAALAQSASALQISGPLSAGSVNALATATGASFSTPPAVHYYEPGPLTVVSGTSAGLYAGNNPGKTSPAGNTIDQILVTLSLDAASLSSLGTITFDLKTAGNAAVGTVSFSSSDFFTSAAGGFPSLMPGTGNGQVNGLSFDSTLHAALSITGLGLSSAATDALIANAIITSPVDLRLDVFGVAAAESIVTTSHGKKGAVNYTTTQYAARIVNHTPNSGALGVTGVVPPPPVSTVPDAGSTLAMLGISGLGLAAFRRARR